MSRLGRMPNPWMYTYMHSKIIFDLTKIITYFVYSLFGPLNAIFKIKIV